MNACILTIGDELLIGQTIDTNAAWLGEHLHAAGVEVERVVTLGDDKALIRRMLAYAYEEHDLTVLTGGLGPTHDDLTREAMAAFFNVGLHFDEAVFERIRQRYAPRGKMPPESNRRLAMVPDGFEPLTNPVGTAPGLWQARRYEGRDRIVVALPGVPEELKALLRMHVLPRLRQYPDLRTLEQRTLLTAGIGESDLQERLQDVAERLDETLRLAYLPGTNGVRLRITALDTDPKTAREHLDAFDASLRERIGAYVYGVDDDSLEAVVGAMLKARGLTIATAESCTGGLLSNRITNVPGASAYLLGGIVAYCNGVKRDFLGISGDALNGQGAVSEAVARQMAENVRARMGADLGVSTTGVAGPTGGTPDKPVGTVWIGYADAATTTAKRLQLTEDRILNIELTCTYALDLVRRRLVALEAEPTGPG